MLAVLFDSMAVLRSNSVLPYGRTEGHRQGKMGLRCTQKLVWGADRQMDLAISDLAVDCESAYKGSRKSTSCMRVGCTKSQLIAELAFWVN